MAATSLHISDQYPLILNDFNTILDLHPEDSDNLYVSEGALCINRGGFMQGPTRTFYSLIREGYNYYDVTRHLTRLKERNIQYINALTLTNVDLTELKLFQKKIKHVAKKLSDLKDALRFIIPQDIKERFRGLYVDFKLQSDSIKEFINEKKTADWQAPHLPINFDEPIRYRKYIHTIPKGASIQDILRLAETAEAQSTLEIPVFRGFAITTIFAGAIASIPFTIFQAATLTPYKKMTHQYDEARTPTGWIVDNIRQSFEQSHVDPRRLLNSYAMCLLRAPIVSDDHVDAFCTLAGHINSDFSRTGPISQYNVVSNNTEELLEMAQSSYFLDDSTNPFNVDLSQLTERSKIILSRIINNNYYTSDQIGRYLTDNFSQLQWVENPDWMPQRTSLTFNQWKQGYTGSDNVAEREAYYTHTCSTIEEDENSYSFFISLHNLLRIVDAIGNNPLCTRFSVGYRVHRIQRLDQRLSQYGFTLDNHHQNYVRGEAARD